MKATTSTGMQPGVPIDELTLINPGRFDLLLVEIMVSM
jgi:hypothetical protein